MPTVTVCVLVPELNDLATVLLETNRFLNRGVARVNIERNAKGWLIFEPGYGGKV